MAQTEREGVRAGDRGAQLRTAESAGLGRQDRDPVLFQLLKHTGRQSNAASALGRVPA